MPEVIINQALEKNLMKYGAVRPLGHPHSHAGTTDLCGVYDNNESIIDFESSNRIKKENG